MLRAIGESISVDDTLLTVGQQSAKDATPVVAVKPGWRGDTFMAVQREEWTVLRVMSLDVAGHTQQALAACSLALASCRQHYRRWQLRTRRARLLQRVRDNQRGESTQTTDDDAAGGGGGTSFADSALTFHVATVRCQQASPGIIASAGGLSELAVPVDEDAVAGTLRDGATLTGTRKAVIVPLPPGVRRSAAISPTCDLAVVNVERAVIAVVEGVRGPHELLADAPLLSVAQCKAKHARPTPCVRLLRGTDDWQTAVRSRTGWRGMHSENLLWRALCVLLCWEPIHAAVPAVADAWQHPWQAAPLDWDAGEVFWQRRKDVFEARFKELCSMDGGQIEAAVLHAFKVRGAVCRLRRSWRV